MATHVRWSQRIGSVRKRANEVAKLLFARARLTKAQYAIAVCTICSILVIGLWTLRSQSTEATVKLNVSKVSFDLSQQSEALLSIPRYVALERAEFIDQIEGDVPQNFNSKGGPFSISATEAALEVSQIRLPSNARVTIETSINSGFSVSLLSEAGARIDAFQAKYPISLGGRNLPPQNWDPPMGALGPSQLRLISSASRGLGKQIKVPIMAWFRQVEPFSTCSVEADPRFIKPHLEGVSVNMIGFTREASSASRVFTSAIIAGRVSIPAIDKTIELSSTDALEMEITSAEIVELKILPCYLAISMRVTASELNIGPKGALNDMRPTYLDLAFKQRNIGFIVSSFFAIWGFLWGFKELFVQGKR